ncbi:MAG: hypothetical protein HC798_00020 [Polaribacter sp.]|nr:hypothetical protein [Polaribacter sp.]
MFELTNKYEIARANAQLFMSKGNIAAYLEALLEMNRYKRLLKAVIAN